MSLLLNVGCGSRFFGKDWVHIDGGDYKHLDSKDVFLRDYESSTASLIYCSHMIEYFDREEVADILSCFMRVLKPGGIFRLAVPDFEAMTRLYHEKGYPIEKFLGPLYGKMVMDESLIYHKTVYDFKSIQHVLQAAGFKDVEKYDWRNTRHCMHDDHSQAYIPHMDKENGTLISLNVECKK